MIIYHGNKPNRSSEMQNQAGKLDRRWIITSCKMNWSRG